jgi:hypothetical protein
MLMKGVPNPNFKGFMVDNAQANWNIVWIVYGSGDPSELMVEREWTCYFHWTQSMDTHKATNQTKDVKIIHYNKRCTYTPSDFIGLWINSLVVMNGT